MKTVLAIPNFNGSENLTDLIDAALKQDFDEIFVFDDASTDRSLEILDAYGDAVRTIRGERNVGAGANRNRIIDYMNEGIIVFIDADMEIISSDIPFKMKQVFKDPLVAVAGGLIRNKKGAPMGWNYGPEMNPVKDGQIGVLAHVAENFPENMELLSFLRDAAGDYLHSVEEFGENEAERNIEREVDWVAEGFFCVRADILKEVGGFDENMRYHETQDICRRIRDKGYKIKFSPNAEVRHLEMEVREGQKEKEFIEAQYYFFKKHWGMSRQVFDLLYGISRD